MLNVDGVSLSYFESTYFPSSDLWLDTHFSSYGHELLGGHVEDVLLSRGLDLR